MLAASLIPAADFERPDHSVLTTSDAWETDIEGQGHDPTRPDLQVGQLTSPVTVAVRLDLDPRTDGDSVVAGQLDPLVRHLQLA